MHLKLRSLKALSKRVPLLKRALSPLVRAKHYFQERRFYKESSILDQLCQVLATDPILKLDEFEGTFSLDCRSHLFKRIVIEREYETNLARLCREYINPDRDVIDVGANVGLYTVLMARQLRSGRVLAVEPTQRALNRLRQNIKTNLLVEKVIVYAGAAADQSGAREIKTFEGMEEYSTLGVTAHPAIASLRSQVELISSSTLDQLILEHKLDPGFVKIDVEGAEHLVLGGAHALLTTHRPVILSELSDYLLRRNGSSSSAIISLFHSFDYDVVDPESRTTSARATHFGDILCIPR